MCVWRSIEAGTTASLWSVARAYPNVSLEIQQGDALITRARSTLATRFLRDLTGDVLFTVDSDILWDPEPFMQVAEQAHDLQAIVVGAYPTRAWGDGQVSSMLGDREIVFGEDPTPVPILYGASGFMAIPRVALERMRDQLALPLLHPKADRRMQFYPFYEAPRGEAPDGQPIGMSEDFDICSKAAQVGIDTYVNPAVRLGHIGQQVFRLEHLIWRQPPIVPLTLSNQGIRFAQVPPALTPLVKGTEVQAPPISRQQRRHAERQREKVGA
jgi:hypothetical protein